MTGGHGRMLPPYTRSAGRVTRPAERAWANGYIQPGTTMTSQAISGATATTEKPKISSSR